MHNDGGPESQVMTYPKGHLNVLAAPYFHVFIIAADLVEIIFRDGEKATSERGRPAENFELENGFVPIKNRRG